MTMLAMAPEPAPAHPGPRIGLRIRAERKRNGWSQEMLHLRSGVSRDAIASLETGKTGEPGALTVHLLARALGVPYDYLVTGRMPEEDLPPERMNLARRMVANLSLEDLSWADRFLAHFALRGPDDGPREPSEREAENEGAGDTPDTQSHGR